MTVEERVMEEIKKQLEGHPLYGPEKYEEVKVHVMDTIDYCIESWTTEGILRLGHNRGILKVGTLIGMGHLSKEVYRVKEVGILGALVQHISGQGQPFRISASSDVAVIWTPPEEPEANTQVEN